MTYEKITYAHASYFPPSSTSQDRLKNQTDQRANDRQPRKPDWLLILVSILFLISLLIAWLADIPSIFR